MIDAPAQLASGAFARDVHGKAALVTGGATGLGRSCAAALVAGGAHVTICGRTDETLRTAAEALGPACRYTVCDVRDEDQVAALVDSCVNAWGRLDIAVVNAGGGGAAGPLILTDRSAWTDTIELNLTSAFLTIKHSARRIAHTGGGSIVAVSSIAGGLTHRYLGPYAVSKAALEMLVRTAAEELGHLGVRVDAVRPGLVATDASAPLCADPETVDDYVAQMPLGRVGTPEEVADAIVFLASDASRWITGQILGVDGGHLLRRGPNLDHLIGGHFAAAEAAVVRGEVG